MIQEERKDFVGSEKIYRGPKYPNFFENNRKGEKSFNLDRGVR